MGMKLLLTGGCGFIGSAVVRHLLRRTGNAVVNVDKLTYAASEEALEEARHHNRHVLVRADVADAAAMRQVFATHQPDAVMHLAAESHVDRSIDGPADFVQTNVVGTFTLLEAARAYYAGLDPARRAAFRFHHVSTDEVFGALGPDDPPFTETTPYDPRSPYAASKAASDHLVRAWHHTYGLPVIVSNTCNNYGPWQFPEKLIPLVTLNALEGKELPVYGDGSNAATGCSWKTTPRRWSASWRAVSPAPPTRSAPASRAPTCRWCRRSAPCWTVACPTRPARAPA